jgi:Amt family ammonium transporter
VESIAQGTDALFILLGAIMVLAMHAGFAFLELGTVRKKNQVNALVKILVDFAVSTIAYFFIGYSVAYGVSFFSGAETLAAKNGYELVKFFFLLTFAAAIPAIVSGGIAERARFGPQLIATAVLVGWSTRCSRASPGTRAFGVQAWIKAHRRDEFHDFAGSVVVHAVGGWIGLAAVLLLGARANRYRKDGGMSAHPPSSIPFLALGAWVLAVGWFGFNVMSAQTIDKISGLVAVNSLMAMVGGTLVATLLGRNDPGFAYNGPLAGLVAVCAGSDVMHPPGRPGHRRHRRRHLRADVHPDAEPLEDRRRAGCVAAARPVRRLGRHRLRHLRPQVSAGRSGWREPGRRSCWARCWAWPGRWPAALWSTACSRPLSACA